jgi:hypothetical protein
MEKTIRDIDDPTAACAFDTASAEELAESPTEDLRDYAVARGFYEAKRGRPSKTAIIDAILASRSGVELPGDEGEDEGEETEAETAAAPIVEPEPAADDSAITPAEARKFESADSATIRDWLARHPEARECLVEYAGLVINRREAEEREAARQAALVTEVPQQYRVTKAARVCRGGQIYTLAAGSIVSHMTHDLEELHKQGVEAEAVDSVRVEHDQAGRLVTVTR